MKQSQGLPVLLMVITFVAVGIFQVVEANDDPCPEKCEGPVGGPTTEAATTEAAAGGGGVAEVCGEKDGKQITYKNKCWLECREAKFVSEGPCKDPKT